MKDLSKVPTWRLQWDSNLPPLNDVLRLSTVQCMNNNVLGGYERPGISNKVVDTRPTYAGILRCISFTISVVAPNDI